MRDSDWEMNEVFREREREGPIGPCNLICYNYYNLDLYLLRKKSCCF